MRVAIDSACCIGTGTCARVCPEVFELGDDGFPVVLQDEPDETLRPSVTSAVELCPTGAITVEG